MNGKRKNMMADKHIELKEFFTQMGNSLEQQWREQQFESSCFPELARNSIEQSQPHKKVSTDLVSEWLFSSCALPEQLGLQSQFGDMALTVYKCEQFYIELLYWLDGTTSIHQHGFCGAFSVLQGSSIHSLYKLENVEIITDTFMFADIELQSCELLNKGDVRAIFPGEQMAHALFHLEQPNISLVVRNYREQSVAHQYRYLPPYLAYCPFTVDEKLECQQRLLSTLFKLDRNLFSDTIESVLPSLSLEYQVRLLSNNVYQLKSLGMLDNVLESFSERFPMYGERVKESLLWLNHSNTILGWRQKTTEKDLRFFLAVILNAPNKETAWHLIQQTYPERVIDSLVFEWLGRLVASSEIDDASLTEDSLPFIDCLLRGMPFEQTFVELGEFFEPDELEKNRALLWQHYQYFKYNSIISCLFKES